MFTSGSKYYFGLAIFAFAAAWLYGAGSGVHHGTMSMVIGPLTVGYKGAVGDHLGYGVLLGLSAVSTFLGCTAIAFRDADPVAQEQILHLDAVPEVATPNTPSHIPLAAAFGFGCALIGLVAGPILFLFGGVVLALVLVEWAARAWSERATGDPEINQRIRNRVMLPVEVPVIGLLIIGAFVLGISRVLLALPEVGADLLFGLVPAVILGIAVLVSYRQQVSRNVIIGILVCAGALLLAAAIYGVAHGERKEKKESAPAPAATQVALPADPGAAVHVRTAQ